ncbi:hypothetical protein BS47DRAFT_1369577 [Hydnum rufescens UP504]|uniref:Uncharacterized protein n=1 Tax=Hydnum rufescens UP504 TaxID=1448309 RepID=A0A9P6ADJ9_9AGAM|nr:hypothetical protein BS47DRAFT_1369577 [Hydnum rufescens UP504]
MMGPAASARMGSEGEIITRKGQAGSASSQSCIFLATRVSSPSLPHTAVQIQICYYFQKQGHWKMNNVGTYVIKPSGTSAAGGQNSLIMHEVGKNTLNSILDTEWSIHPNSEKGLQGGWDSALGEGYIVIIASCGFGHVINRHNFRLIFIGSLSLGDGVGINEQGQAKGGLVLGRESHCWDQEVIYIYQHYLLEGTRLAKVQQSMIEGNDKVLRTHQQGGTCLCQMPGLWREYGHKIQ